MSTFLFVKFIFELGEITISLSIDHHVKYPEGHKDSSSPNSNVSHHPFPKVFDLNEKSQISQVTEAEKDIEGKLPKSQFRSL